MKVRRNLLYFRDLLDKSTPILEKVFPKSISEKSLLLKYLRLPEISKRIKIPDEIPIESFNKAILSPGWSMVGRGGKKWRPLLGLMISSPFIKDLQNIKKHETLYKLLYISDLFHNASLIIDDIEDRSLNRRGKKCVHLLFGEDIAINAGFAMMVFPMNSIINQFKDEKVKGKILEKYFEELTSVHLGQGWDIEMKCTKVPSIRTYIDTVLCKTGVCPRLINKMTQVYIENILKIPTGNYYKKIIDLCDDLSIGFQIWDDLMNLIPSTVSKNKNKIGEDITEGKLTIMALHTLRGDFNNKGRFKEILTSSTKNQDEINEAIEIMKENGSIDFSIKKKDFYINRFSKKLKRVIDGNITVPQKRLLDLNSLYSLEELKNSLIRV